MEGSSAQTEKSFTQENYAIRRNFVNAESFFGWPDRSLTRPLPRNFTSTRLPSKDTDRRASPSLTSMFRRSGGKMRESGAKRRVKERRLSFHSTWMPIHSPFR